MDRGDRSCLLGGKGLLGIWALLWIACSGQVPRGNQAQPPGVLDGTAGAPPSENTTNTGGSAGSNPGVSVADCGTASVGAAPLRRLTRAQLQNTLAYLLSEQVDLAGRITDDEKVGPFRSNAVTPVSRVQIEEYATVAAELAQLAAPQLADCAGGDEAACASNFIASFGRRAFRRPLTAEEASRYQALYDQYRSLDSHNKGIQLVVEAMLQSPNLLYHLEFGDGSPAPASLSPHELASRLSFLFWDTAPDDALLDAAATGQLDARGEAQRLLSDDRARNALASFHLQWLQLDHLLDLTKDADSYPEFSPELAAAMQREAVDFFDHVIRTGDARLHTLFTANYSLVPDALLGVYDTARPAGVDPATPLQLDPTVRAGFLTQPGFLASHAHPNQTSPVRRGVSVRESILCQPLPDPPPNVDSTPPVQSPDATTRQRFAAHVEDPSCSSCHLLIDPIGLGFENYDAIGRYRTMENGLPVDGSGELTGIEGGPVSFVGAVELAGLLAQSEQVQRCMTTQWFRYATGRLESAADECSVQSAHAAFAASGYDVRELLLALVGTDAFRLYGGEVGP